MPERTNALNDIPRHWNSCNNGQMNRAFDVSCLTENQETLDICLWGTVDWPDALDSRDRDLSCGYR